MARYTPDPNYSAGPDGDRLFIRIDDNPFAPESIFDPNDAALPSIFDPNDSIFADDEYVNSVGGGAFSHIPQTTALLDHIQREILELGFPDDGYNYSPHLGEIKNTGGGYPEVDDDQFTLDFKLGAMSENSRYMDFGQPSSWNYEDKICSHCHEKLQIRVCSARSRHQHKLFYYCEEHAFNSWCNPVNEQNEIDYQDRDSNVAKGLKMKKDLKNIASSVQYLLQLTRVVLFLVGLIVILVMLK